MTNITALSTPAHVRIARLMLELAISMRTIESVPASEAQAALDFEQELTARIKDAEANPETSKG